MQRVSCPEDNPHIAISACLLGKRVRYNGQHKKNELISSILGSLYTFIPFCPEYDCGMPVPRPALRLVGTEHTQRMLCTVTGKDWTDTMHGYSQKYLAELEKYNIIAYIFKHRSPSCGLTKVPITAELSSDNCDGSFGTGLFAAACRQTFPYVPMREEHELANPTLLANFIQRLDVGTKQLGSATLKMCNCSKG